MNQLTVFISGWTCGEVLPQFSVCLAPLNVASTVPHPLSGTRWQEVLQGRSWWPWALGPCCTGIHPFFPADCSSDLRFPVNFLPSQTPAGHGLPPPPPPHSWPRVATALQLATGYHRPPPTAGRKGEVGGGVPSLLPFVWVSLVSFRVYAKR